MTELLIELMERTITWLSNPWVTPVAMLLVTASIVLAIATSGTPLLVCDHTGPAWFLGCKWDPGANYTNAFQNEVQLLLLFVTFSLARKTMSHARAAHGHSRATHDAIRKHK